MTAHLYNLTPPHVVTRKEKFARRPVVEKYFGVNVSDSELRYCWELQPNRAFELLFLYSDLEENINLETALEIFFI